MTVKKIHSAGRFSCSPHINHRPAGALKVKAEGREPHSLGSRGHPCALPGLSHLPGASLSLTSRPLPQDGPVFPDPDRAPDPEPQGPPAARPHRPSPDPTAGPPRTSRRAGGAPRPPAAASSQSRPRSSRAGGYRGGCDPSGLHAPGGGGAGARVPALLAQSRAPGTQGRGRGGIAGRAPAAAPPRPGPGARARNPAARARGAAGSIGERATRPPRRRRVRAQPPDWRWGRAVLICEGGHLV